jgi:hypothetical protein
LDFTALLRRRDDSHLFLRQKLTLTHPLLMAIPIKKGAVVPSPPKPSNAGQPIIGVPVPPPPPPPKKP